MKFLLGLLFGLIVAIGIAFAAVKVAFGSLDNVFDHTFVDDKDGGGDVTKTLDLVDFDKIEIAGVYELEVTVGPPFSVELSGSQKAMEKVEARVENGALMLDRRDEDRTIRFGKHQGVKARVSLPALSSVEASGVVDGEVTGVNSETFSVEISGVGDMNLSGECGALTAQVSGVGDLDAEDLKCKSVEVEVSGVGAASVYASETADATISGMGEIEIYGSPKTVEKADGMFSHIEVK